MHRLTKTISMVLIWLFLFSLTNAASAKKNIAAINNTKNYIGTDENGFFNVNSSSTSDTNKESSKSTSTNTKDAKKSGVGSTINNQSKYKFQCGLAAVIIKNKVGYIDKKGKLIIPAVFDDGTMFYEDAAFVKKGVKWALIDNTGKLLTDYIFDDIDGSESLYKDVEINGYHGLLSSEGKLVIPPVYSGILDVDGENNISLSTYDNLKKMTVQKLIGSFNTYGEASYNSSYTPFGNNTSSSILSALNNSFTRKQFSNYDRVWSLGNGLYCGYKSSTNSYLVFDKTGKQVYTSK